MLAGLLNSSKAIEIETNMQFSDIYQALTEMAGQKEEAEKPRIPVGFKL